MQCRKVFYVFYIIRSDNYNIAYCYTYVTGLIVSLFSWRYNPLWLYFHSLVAGFSFLVFEVS
jgi:hypothetical protein